jgi:hypothetical protein
MVIEYSCPIAHVPSWLLGGSVKGFKEVVVEEMEREDYGEDDIRKIFGQGEPPVVAGGRHDAMDRCPRRVFRHLIIG